MPRSLHPGSKVSIVLDCDKDLTPPPTFVFRAPTMLDEEILGSAYDLNDKNAKTLAESVTKSIHHCLVEVQNLEGITAKNNVSEYLCAAEGFELISKLLASGRLDSEEKKSLESPD